MARICELTGKRPMKGSIIWRSGKSKKSGGIGTHVTAITKRKFHVNLQRVKAADAQRRSPLHPRLRQRHQKRSRHQGAQTHLEKGSRKATKAVKA